MKIRYIAIHSCLLAISVLIVLLFRADPVLADQTLSLAEWLLEQESYDAAITEYKRFIFFNPENENLGHAFFGMGLAYRALHNWQEAIDALRASVFATKDSRIADERRIILATTLIASGNYSLARLELIKVSEFSKYPSLRLKSIYFRGIASLYMYDWDAASEAFGDFYSEYDAEKTTEQAKEIDAVLQKAGQSYKSVRLAKVLSTIIPGLGQMYAGNWRDALNALVLNSLTIGLIANAVYSGNYKDAMLLFSVSTRYYMGNRYRAEVNVTKHNESRDRESALEVLRLIRADEPSW